MPGKATESISYRIWTVAILEDMSFTKLLWFYICKIFSGAIIISNPYTINYFGESPYFSICFTSPSAEQLSILHLSTITDINSCELAIYICQKLDLYANKCA